MPPIHHRRGEKRDKKRLNERLRMVTFRMPAFLWPGADDKPIVGFSFVADLSESGAGLYLPKKIKEGTGVRLSFESEEAPSFQGSVVWCRRFSLEQHFLGHEMLSYRVGIKFRFASEPERRRYVAFLKEVRERIRLIRSGMVF